MACVREHRMRESPVAWHAAGIHGSFSISIRSTQILGFLISMALGRPKLTLAIVILVLAVLAGTMTYTGFLVIGVLAAYLDTGRLMAGLLVGALFARIPWISKGKLRVIGLLPRPARRPLILSLLALSALHFLSRGDYLLALFPGFTAAFVLAYPWLRKAVWTRISSSIFRPAHARTPSGNIDDRVIDGEFREKKD
jgi:hypothetical protein